MNKKRMVPFGFAVSMLLGLIFTSQLYAQSFWPPQLGQKFPDTEFIDQSGNRLKISDFKGNVIVVEYIGMNCPACQALSGAGEPSIGPFENNAVQRGMPSLEKTFQIYAKGISLFDNGITFVQVLLYDMKMGPPQPEDAKQWAQHFRMNEKSKSVYVVVPTQDLRGDASYNLIPGCHLVDKNLVVQSDSAGHNPRHDFVDHFLPMVAKVLKE